MADQVKENQQDPSKDRVTEIVLADIKARGPIFRALMAQIEQELNRFGESLHNRRGSR